MRQPCDTEYWQFDVTRDLITRPTPFVPRDKPGQSGRLPEWLFVLKLFGKESIEVMIIVILSVMMTFYIRIELMFTIRYLS